MDLDRLKQLIEDDPQFTTSCWAEQFECSHITVETHLTEIGETWKYEVWIPYELSVYQLQYRLNVCMDRLISHLNYEWLYNFITGDEKWMLYINYMRKRQWPSADRTVTVTPKQDLHLRKVMLSVW